MEFRLLGPLEVAHRGEPVSFGGPQRRMVLAILLVNPNEAVSTDSLIDQIWGDEPPAGARKSLQSHVANLRKAVNVDEELLKAQPPGYKLEVEASQVDSLRFEDLVREAGTALAEDPAGAREKVTEALGLWRGAPLADLADEPPLRPVITRLEERRLDAVERRIDADVALGNHQELVGELESLTREHPLRERFWGQLMLVLYRSGRQAEALRTFQKARQILGEELGIDPSPELQTLEQQILAQDSELELAPAAAEVTFLFTDLEGSSVLWEAYPNAMGAALERHDQLISAKVSKAGGEVFKGTGDGLLAAMPDVRSAVAAAEEAQRALRAEDWGDVGPLNVRMAIHVGEAERRSGDYFGPSLNRAARLVAGGHGGQVLLSSGAREALDDADVELIELGEHRLRSLGRVEVVYQLVVEGLPAEFPDLRLDRSPVHLQAAGFGRSVRGYELREVIGEGDFGIVYRAYQASVGREVALKAIRPEYANNPDFVRSFESEAQFVAQLEHAHIVSLYDYWREPDNAYLVMPWMRGGSLRTALERGALQVEAVLKLVDQVGAALSYAHRHGVLHRDLKPSNVLLDEDGNAYLSDFGVAGRLDDPDEPSRPWTGSPAYLSPEIRRDEPLSPRSDIYSLGMMLWELLTGEPLPVSGPLPLVSSARSDLPEEADAVILRATTGDPAGRYETVRDMVAALHDAVGAEALTVRTARPSPAELRNPYKGLRPFFETDADDFFGRQEFVDVLLGKVATARLTAVVGPSGSGKSSAVRAGLVPALRAGRLPGSKSWFVTDMFPGSYPFEELESALLKVAVREPTAVLEHLEQESRGLLRVSKQILPDDDSELVLLVDQFEELFTLTDNDEVRQLFLDSLIMAVNDERSRVRVVLTLRADFFDRPLEYWPFSDFLRQGLVTITPLSDEGLADVVEGPAAGVGLELEPGLVGEITSDVREQPGALPLLQYALTELFERREDGRLTVSGYEASGGVLGALGRRAEEIYETLDRPGREACRQLFLRLVSVGEVDDTRRRVTRAELRGLDIDQTALDRVIDLFGERRLLSFDRDPVSRAPTVEVAHEALLREWQRLRDWIESRRDDLRFHRRLASSTQEWLSAEQDASYLLRGGRLEQTDSWAAETDLSLTRDERDFLDESRRQEDARSQRRRTRRRAIAGVLAAATVISLVLAAFALRQQGEAQEQALIAQARELAAASVANLDVDPERSVLLAVEAVDAYLDAGQPLREAEEALHRAVQASRVLLTVPSEGAVFFSPDGTRVVTGGEADAWVWDANTGELLTTLQGHAGLVFNAVFSPDGTRVATNSQDATTKIWNSETGDELLTLPGHNGANVISVAISPGSTMVATSSPPDQTVKLWDINTGEELLVLPNDEPSGVNFSPDGSLLAVADRETTKVWDVASGELVGALPGVALDVAFSPDGTLLAAGSDDTAVWDVQTGEKLRTLTGHLGEVQAVDFGPGPFGPLVATGAIDGLAIVWDAASGRELVRLAGHGTAVINVAFSPDGTRLATGGVDGTARVWDITPEGSREWLTITGQPAAVDVAFSPNGTRLATSGFDGTGGIWDAVTGAQMASLVGHAEPVRRIEFSPDGSLVATASFDGTARIWNAQTGEQLTVFEADFPVGRVAFSPDGSLLAASGGPGHPCDTSVGLVRIWNVKSGDTTLSIQAHDEVAADVDFSPDGTMFVTSHCGMVKMWDTATGTELWQRQAHTGFNPAILQVDISPDGRLLATGSWDGTAKLWVAGTGEELRTLEGHTGEVWSVGFSPDGSRLATASADGTVRLWEVDTGREVLILTGHSGIVAQAVFSPDGRKLATAGSDETVRVYALDIADLLTVAEQRVTRTLTDDECRQYLHVEACP